MAEDSESELDTIVQGGDPVTESEKPAEKAAEVPEKKGMSQTLIAILIGIGAVIVVGYMYLSGHVDKKNAELEQEYINRKKDYVIQAHRRMYDTIQGQLQAEMMDRTATNPQPDSTNLKDSPSPSGASHGTE
ncbi:MAG: TrbC/VirB2 family protein [Magnetococcus sp. THC-1_WYH]